MHMLYRDREHQLVKDRPCMTSSVSSMLEVFLGEDADCCFLLPARECEEIQRKWKHADSVRQKPSEQVENESKHQSVCVQMEFYFFSINIYLWGAALLSWWRTHPVYWGFDLMAAFPCTCPSQGPFAACHSPLISGLCSPAHYGHLYSRATGVHSHLIWQITSDTDDRDKGGLWLDSCVCTFFGLGINHWSESRHRWHTLT